MSEIKTIKCPYCGSIDGIKKYNDKCKCGYCDCEFYIISEDYQRTLDEAYNYMIRYKFDDADFLYHEISRAAKDNENEELYVMAEWGRLLAYFGVVYVRSFNGKVSIPTFAKFDSRFDSVTKSEFYSNIMDSDASDEIKEKYKQMASKLDETYSRIKDELAKSPEYDVFLCVKISLTTEKNPDAEGFTKDSKIADNIYDELTRRGLKVFYSEKCCQGIEYDSQILSALSRSKMLLVISTKKEYLESVWVQSEWRRWLNFIKLEEKEKNSLILHIPNYDNGFELPTILSKKKIQYYDQAILAINHICDTLKPTSKEKEEDNKYDEIIANLSKKIESLEENKISNFNENDEKADDKIKSIDKILSPKEIKELKLKSTKEFEELKKKADLGDSVAQCEVGVCFANGNGVNQDDIEAYNYFKLSADQGNADAQFYLGDAYENGKGLQINLEQAFKYYKLSADKGNSVAQARTAKCYMNGTGVVSNFKKAFHYNKLAVEQDNAEAQKALGSMYYNGNGTKVNYEEAFRLYKLAANQGNIDAVFNIGVCYENGNGLEKNINKAIKYFELAAEHGMNCHYHIGKLYEINLKDYTNALKHYQLSIDNKDKNANLSYLKIGNFYLEGKGLEKNPEEALKYYNLSYDAGNLAAANNIGDCYYEGNGVNQDMDKAMKYYKKAGNSILATNQLRMKDYYFKHKGKKQLIGLFSLLGLAIILFPFIAIKYNLIISIIDTALFAFIAFFNLLKNIYKARSDNYINYSMIIVLSEIITGLISLVGIFLIIYFNLYIHHPTNDIVAHSSLYNNLYLGVCLILLCIPLILLHVEDKADVVTIIISILLGLSIVYLSTIVFLIVINGKSAWWDYCLYGIIVFGIGLCLITLDIILSIFIIDDTEYLEEWIFTFICLVAFIICSLTVLCAICCWKIWAWNSVVSIIYVILAPFIIGGTIFAVYWINDKCLLV